MKRNILYVAMMLVLAGGCVTSEKCGEMLKHDSSSNCPEDLYEKVTKEFGYKPGAFDVISWSKINWLKQTKIVSCQDIKGSRVVFLYKNGQYLRLDCPEGIPYINEVLQEFTFKEGDFRDIHKSGSFLQAITDMYDTYELDIATMRFFRMTKDLDIIMHWLPGRMRDEDVFKSLCSDPEFVFKGNQWNIYFNVFTSSGSVDQWHVKGEYFLKKEIVQIRDIKIKEIKPEGTFSYRYKEGPIPLRRDYD